MKTLLNILHTACVGAVILAVVVHFLGSFLNMDARDKQFENALNIALFSTIIVVAITFLLVLWRPGFLQSIGFLQKDGIRVIIALLGAVSAVIIAISPLAITLPKLYRDAKIVEQQRPEQQRLQQQAVKQQGIKFLATTQEYIRLKKQLSGVETKDYLARAYEILFYNNDESGLVGWKRLLEAKVIDPNIETETKFHPNPYNINDEITGMQPILNYALTYDIRFGEALLQYGAHPNITDNVEGNTALIELAEAGIDNNKLEKINLVLSCGADTFIKNKAEKTALDVLMEERAKTAPNAYSTNVNAGIAELNRIDREIEAVKAAQNNPGTSSSCKK